MSLRINTNVAALNAYNNLNNNQSKLESAFEQLSSGLRINKAADDASGLSIAQGLSSQINGLTQAVSNANDATNVAQIADGSLGTVQDILQRMRTLVVQASNTGTQDTDSLSAIGSEVSKLNDQLNNIANQTKFGQTNLLNGSYSGVFQIGADGGNTITLSLDNMGLASGSAAGGVSASNLGGTAAASGVALSSLNILAFSGGTGSASGYTATGASGSNAQVDLNSIDAAIKQISNARSAIGAVQNQLSYTTANLQTAITNVTASRSNLTDADLATEVTQMTQQQILTQAATSVLAQANSAPQAILKLLQ
jgi:flagellin